MRSLPIFAALLALIFLACGGTGTDTTTGQGRQGRVDPLRVTAEELVEAFDANEAAANFRFAGKFVEVSGTVSQVNSSGKGSGSSVHFDLPVGKNHRVVCSFSASAEREVANLQRGQEVTVTGFLKQTGVLVIIKDSKVKLTD